jgi:hypothetical protein
MAQAIGHPNGLRDPTILTDVSTLLSELLYRYVDAFSGQDRASTEQVLRDALDAVAADLVDTCLPQIRSLGQVVFRILQERRVVAEGRRLVLVELPIGNSIPVQVLRHFLEKHRCTVEVLSVSLSRNDKQRQGITRRQLLQDRLQTILEPGDLVIYLDEWLTGSNFRSVSEHIARVLRQSPKRDVSLLPVGMLANASRSDRDYLSRVQKHEKLVDSFGFGSDTSSRFRAEFPPVGVIVRRPGYFFWSEHPWMAGYRKIQLLGMALSIVDEAVEGLMKDPNAWARAVRSFLVHVAKRRAQGDSRELDFPPDIIERPDSFRKSCWEDYKQLRGQLEVYVQDLDQLRAISHPSNLGQCDNPTAAVTELTVRILEIIKDRPAMYCIGLGLAGVENALDRRFKRRDVFEEHVPVVVELQPALRWFHDRLLQRIITAIES